VAFTCPRCGMTSQAPADEADGWCGACCAQTGGALEYECRGCRRRLWVPGSHLGPVLCTCGEARPMLPAEPARPSCVVADPVDGMIEVGGYQVHVVTDPLVPAGRPPGRVPFHLVRGNRSRGDRGPGAAARGRALPLPADVAERPEHVRQRDAGPRPAGPGERVAAAVAAWPRWRASLTQLQDATAALIIRLRRPGGPDCQDEPDDYPWFNPFTWQADYSEGPEPVD